jgi:hypothetical protein
MTDSSINEGHYLELMDRLHVISCTIDDHILGHALVERSPKTEELVSRALSLLAAAYHSVGQEHERLEEEKSKYVQLCIPY